MDNPIFCAIDTDNIGRAKQLVERLDGVVGGFKVGLQFFCRHGPESVRAVVGDQPLFLDLKLLDIPNTVSGAIRSVLPLRPEFLTIHASGDRQMMEAAVEAADMAPIMNLPRPKILGVTVLTSVRATLMQVAELARSARDAGLDGLVCSPKEIGMLRTSVSDSMILMVPGIRPTGSAPGDQHRTGTPEQALADGADYLVIGRPITNAPDPRTAAKEILEDIAFVNWTKRDAS